MALDETARQRILAAVDSGFEAQLAFTADMVRHDSTRGNEAAMQDFMARAFRERGFEVDHWRIEVDDIRDLPGFSPVVDVDYAQAFNVVATHRPKAEKGRSLIVNGHIDVVPPCDAARWTTPPFEPRIEGGRMYGRGAGDMKSGLAAGIFAIDAIRAAGFQPAATVHIQSVVEEECTGNGTLACLQRCYKADGALVPEPFGASIMRAEVGLMWLCLDLEGERSFPEVECGFAGADLDGAGVEVVKHSGWEDSRERGGRTSVRGAESRKVKGLVRQPRPSRPMVAAMRFLLPTAWRPHSPTVRPLAVPLRGIAINLLHIELLLGFLETGGQIRASQST